MIIKSADHVNLLKKVPIIKSVKEILLEDDHRSVFGTENFNLAKKNSRFINIYRIEYTSNANSVVGFVIIPKVKKSEKIPCIIYNRGGTNDFGILKLGTLFYGLPSKLALSKYIVVASQYSGNDGGTGKDMMGGEDLNDVLILKKIIDSIPNADSKRIGMYGESRGGIMNYLSITKVSWVKTVVTVGGVTNLLRQEKLRPEMKELFKGMFGGSSVEKNKRSALMWVNLFPLKVPLLIIHGGSDWRVSPLDSIDLSKKLTQHYIPHRFVLFEGSDHAITEHLDECTRLVISWLDRFLKSDETIPDAKPHGK